MNISAEEFAQIQTANNVHHNFVGELKPNDSIIMDRLRREAKHFVDSQRKEHRKWRKNNELLV